jgi:hypothetical protein
MEFPELEKSVRDELRSELGKLNSLDAKELVRADELGQDSDFQDGLPYFQRSLRLFRDLSEVNLDMLSNRRLQSLWGAVQEARKLFSEIEDVPLPTHSKNRTRNRSHLIHQIRSRYDSWYTEVAPVIAYSAWQDTDIDRIEQELRSIAAKVGVAHHARHFKNEAEQHAKIAKIWLGVVILIAIATVALAGVNVYLALITTDLGTPQTIQLAVAKVLLFSLLFGALVWAGRVYRSHRHNFVVNQHRQNALTSFETFATAASDDQTKGAVLIEATRCIFSPQTSGYADSVAADSATPRIMEIIRGITAKE